MPWRKSTDRKAAVFPVNPCFADCFFRDFMWKEAVRFFVKKKIAAMRENARKIHSIRPETGFSSKNKHSFPHELYEEFFNCMLKSMLKVFKTP